MPEKPGEFMSKELGKELGIKPIEQEQVEKAVGEARVKLGGGGIREKPQFMDPFGSGPEPGAHLHHPERPFSPFGEEQGARYRWSLDKARNALRVEEKTPEAFNQALQRVKSERLRKFIDKFASIKDSEIRVRGPEFLAKWADELRDIKEEELEEFDREAADILEDRIGRRFGKFEREAPPPGPPGPPEGPPAPPPERPAVPPEIPAEESPYMQALARLAERMTGRLPAEEERILREDNPQKWLRERLDRLEAVDLPFRQGNQPIFEEILIAIPTIREVNPNLEKEFYARYILHDLYLTARQQSTLKDLSAISKGLTRERFQILFQLKPTGGEQAAVAEAFRKYEERGHEAAAATDTEYEAINREITQAIGGEEWARRIAEKLWILTGRSSYYDAYNRDPGTRLKGRGIFIYKRLYNFKEFIGERKDVLDFWKKGGKGYEYLDLKTYDFWSEFDERFLKYYFPNLEQLRDQNGFLTSLGRLSFEEMDFTNGVEFTENGQTRPLVPPEDPFDFYAFRLSQADVARPLFMDPGGLLEQPTAEKFSELMAAFGHLKNRAAKDEPGTEKQKLMANYLDALIEFNKKRWFIGSYSKRELGKEAWDSAQTRDFIEKFFSAGYITRKQADELEKKHEATLLQAILSRWGKAFLRRGPLEFLKSVAEGQGMKLGR